MKHDCYIHLNGYSVPLKSGDIIKIYNSQLENLVFDKRGGILFQVERQSKRDNIKGKSLPSLKLEKYPDDGCMHLCKDCMTMHVDNWDPETFLWILQEADVPWIPDEWNGLLAKFAKDPKKMSGKSIIGRYLAKMQLK